MQAFALLTHAVNAQMLDPDLQLLEFVTVQMYALVNPPLLQPSADQVNAKMQDLETQTDFFSDCADVCSRQQTIDASFCSSGTCPNARPGADCNTAGQILTY